MGSGAASVTGGGGGGTLIAFTQFQTPTATGDLTITTTDLGGQTPVGAYFFLGGGEVNDVEYGFSQVYACNIVGGCDGTNQFSTYGGAKNSSGDDTRGWSSARCILQWHTSMLMSATFVEFVANGVKINFDTLDTNSQDKLGFVLFFAGANTECAIRFYNNIPLATPETENFGFTPDAVFCSSSIVAAEHSYPGPQFTEWGFAVNDGVPTQYQCGIWRDSGNGNGYMDNTTVISNRTANPVTASFSGTSMTLTAPSNFPYDVAAFGFTFGGDLSVEGGDFSSPTTATTVTESGLGITPDKVFVLMTRPDDAVWGTQVAGHAFGWGYFSATEIGSCASFGGKGFGSISKIWNQGVEEAVVDSMDATGFTLDFTTANAVTVRYPYLAFGS
jgi:hypothetical protein